jgi:hypothetical protein
MKYQKQILNYLLDKYEGSKHYYGDAAINRRITLKFNSKQFPQYDLENVEVKAAVHQVVSKLQNQSIIEINWLKHEEGNILDSVNLNIDKIDMAYRLLGRKPKKKIIEETLQKVSKLRAENQTGWICVFLDKMIQEIRNGKNLPKYIPGEKETLDLLLKTLAGISEKGEDEIMERIFSRKYLGGSKIFEKKIRSRLVTIIKKFKLNDADIEDEEALENVGIIKTSEELLFIGPLKAELCGRVIDYAGFCFGAAMNTETIKYFEVAELDVKTVITIENKAAYLEYIKNKNFDSQLIIYLGGFYSPTKRIFLQKIYNYLKKKKIPASFYHWGDIDIGGFNIFLQLRDNIIPKLQYLYMDVQTLEEYAEYGDDFNKNYRNKLESIFKKPQYAIFHDVIAEMIKRGIRLEQEAIV